MQRSCRDEQVVFQQSVRRPACAEHSEESGKGEADGVRRPDLQSLVRQNSKSREPILSDGKSLEGLTRAVIGLEVLVET